MPDLARRIEAFRLPVDEAVTLGEDTWRSRVRTTIDPEFPAYLVQFLQQSDPEQAVFCMSCNRSYMI